MRSLFIAAAIALTASAAHAQSFGQDMVDQVTAYNARNTAYGQISQQVQPVQPPITTMDGVTYMTLDGPIINRGNGVYFIPSGQPIDTTVNGRPFTRF